MHLPNHSEQISMRINWFKRDEIPKNNLFKDFGNPTGKNTCRTSKGLENRGLHPRITRSITCTLLTSEALFTSKTKARSRWQSPILNWHHHTRHHVLPDPQSFGMRPPQLMPQLFWPLQRSSIARVARQQATGLVVKRTFITPTAVRQGS